MCYDWNLSPKVYVLGTLPQSNCVWRLGLARVDFVMWIASYCMDLCPSCKRGFISSHEMVG